VTLRIIIHIILSVIVATTLFPIFGSATMQRSSSPAYPTIAPTPQPGMVQTMTPPRHPVDKAAACMSDVVISMLAQVGTAQFLNYEENLTNFGPRETGNRSCIAAAAFIYSQFENMRLRTRYDHWNSSGYSSDNVEATINGTNESSDEIFIVCAHYDTVAVGPGADDDTSGTCAVLMAAQIMSQYQFDHTLKFVTFSGEEQGLLGSAVYAEEAKAQGWDIIGVLNCDMISYAITEADRNNLMVYFNNASEWLYTFTFDVNTRYINYTQLILHNGGTRGSDQDSFWAQGYDAIFYREFVPNPYHHTPGDTMAHINASYAVKTIRLAIATLAELAVANYMSNPPEAPALTGPTSCIMKVMYFYNVSTIDPDGDDVFYLVDWGDGTNSGWLGPFPSGQTESIQKTWTVAGWYNVRAKAKDVHGLRSGLSELLLVNVVIGRPPNAPTITGPHQGRPGTPYLCTFTTTDPDGDDVWYWVDWGDNTTSGWLGPYVSGATALVNHQWNTKGTYTIRAKAKDSTDMVSDWGTFQVIMPDSLIFEHGPLSLLLERFFTRHPNAFPILRQLFGL
jgi:hypothetical protein